MPYLQPAITRAGAVHSIVQTIDGQQVITSYPNEGTDLYVSTSGKPGGGAQVIQGDLAVTGSLSVKGNVVCNPKQCITATKTINPVNTTGPASVFTIDVPIVPIPNAEYDIQVRGAYALISGTPSATDQIYTTVLTGAGSQSTETITSFPGIFNTGQSSGSGPFTTGTGYAYAIRTRLVAPATPSNYITVTVRAILGGGSTAVYSSALTQFDVTLVGLN